MSTVYFFMMHDPANPDRDFEQVKVGITDGDVARRIAQLQTGNPWELRCVDSFETPCARRVEHFIHRAHAEAMQQLEWLRCSRGNVRALVEEAKQAARRIEERSSRERAFASRPSNGVVRRPSREEAELHRDVRNLKTKLVPEELRRGTAEALLAAATGATLGIPGVVVARQIAATTRFSSLLAEAKFPALADACRVTRTEGRFCWLKTPTARHFPAADRGAKAATAAADAAASLFLAARTGLEGLSDRTTEHERHHDEFLKATQLVTSLEADLADLQSELTIGLGEDEGLVGVCSYKRYVRARINKSQFCKTFPEEASQCAELVPAQVRKRVYPTRSYW